MERFGHYELGSLLGRGGMGEVYRARDTRKDRGEIALKRLPAGLGADGDFRRRFLREAEMTARLREPHVIPIHDYGQIDDQPYLDMRLVEGADLGRRLGRGDGLEPDRAAGVLTQIAGALDAAHRDGLVHRDVKPQNILFDRPETDDPSLASDFVYLIDFGLSANILTSRRSSSLVSGTAAYMAPERFTAGGDHRVDVYALGCVLYEMLTGTPPFDGDLMQLMWAHAHQPPPAVTDRRPHLPAALDRVVATAMAKDPHQRYATAGAVAAAAREALQADAAPRSATLAPRLPNDAAAKPSPLRPSPATPAPSQTNRLVRRIFIVVGSAVALALFVGVGLVVWPVLDHRPPSTVASVITPSAGTGARAIGFSPDGDTAYVEQSGELSRSESPGIFTPETGPTAVALLDMSSRSERPGVRITPGHQPSHDRLGWNVAVSPDGQHVYVPRQATSDSNDRGGILVIDTATNSVQTTIPTQNPLVIALTPDGRFLYVGDSSGSMKVIDTAARRVVTSISLPGKSGFFTEIVMSSDGRRVYGTSLFTKSLTVIDTAGNKVVGSVPLPASPNGLAVSPDERRVYTVGDGGLMSVIDTSNYRVIATVDLGSPGRALSDVAVSPDGRYAFVVGIGDRLDIIDTSTNTVVKTVQVESSQAVAVSPDGSAVIAASPYTNHVTILTR